MRQWIFIIWSFVFMFTLIGCERKSLVSLSYPHDFLAPNYVSPNLLLQEKGKPIVDPQLFSFRSAWPSTPGYYHFSETTYYLERWYDRQTTYPHAHDYTYRLFRSYRSGVKIK